MNEPTYRQRIETAARALARHRLARHHSMSPNLSANLVASLRQRAEDKLWPSLVEEAKSVVDALDRFEP